MPQFERKVTRDDLARVMRGLSEGGDDRGSPAS
jgi:hypothetical protein